jgi:hypothetical protein
LGIAELSKLALSAGAVEAVSAVCALDSPTQVEPSARPSSQAASWLGNGRRWVKKNKPIMPCGTRLLAKC